MLSQTAPASAAAPTGPRPYIFIVEDDQPVRESLELAVEQLGTPVRSFGSAEQFLEAYLDVASPLPGGQTKDASGPARTFEPGCLILDVRMPGMSGLELHRELVDRGCPVVVIIVSGHADVPTSVESMRRGALDVLEKPYSPDALRDRVRDGLDKSVELLAERQRAAEIAARAAELTAREQQVYELLLSGLETKQVARELGISPSTVEKHRLKVFDKMGVDTVPRLMRLVLGGGEAKK